jgi:hypothetical protein
MVLTPTTSYHSYLKALNAFVNPLAVSLTPWPLTTLSMSVHFTPLSPLASTNGKAIGMPRLLSLAHGISQIDQFSKLPEPY